MNDYIFTSERLGFRNWRADDADWFHRINSNTEVMRHFPKTYTLPQTEQLIERMQQQFNKHQFCYFAVEILATKENIGFIGLCEQTYEIDFNPSVDIGWRIHPDFWHKGYATEGAKACLHYGFEHCNLPKIVSVATKNNTPSISVMQKIGMQKVKEFKHPLLVDYPDLEDCVLYEVTKV